MRSVYLQSDKSIFKVDKLPAEDFAAALGLPGAPKIKFVKVYNKLFINNLFELCSNNFFNI
jgi:hypothetical protein